MTDETFIEHIRWFKRYLEELHRETLTDDERKALRALYDDLKNLVEHAS